MDNIYGLKIGDMLQKKSLLETDILIVEDSENTKKVTLKDLIISIIKDEEAPANFRLYSSEKVNTLFRELSSKLEEEFGKVGGGYTEAMKILAKREELNDLKKYVDEELGKKINEDKALEAIDKKRDKSIPIKSEDLDTSSDQNKIKLKNLSEEVISAMTGGEAIPVSKAPDGGWTSEDIANSSIISTKLSSNYRYIQHLISGNINDLVKDGLYTLGPDVEGLPKMSESDEEIRILDVEVANNYIIQTIYYTNDYEERPIYRRKGSKTRLHVMEFIEIHEVSPTFKIGRNMLKDEYNNNGLISSGSIYSYLNEGHYYAESTVEGLPSNDSDYLVEVKKFNDYYIYTAEKISTKDCIVYHSVLYFQAGYLPINSQWYTISTTSKSKFDGKRVYLFGDETLFGSGSSDITTKSIAAILSNKYGMIVYNRSIVGATFGNYGDEQLAESSILKQIETTPLDNADYVMVLGGTEDWRLEISELGTSTNNYTTNDTSFKGSVALAIKSILEKNNKVKIIFFTPIFRSRINYGDGKNSDLNAVNDIYLSEYADAMIEVCKAHHIPVANLYVNSMINQYTAEVYLRDGLTPNDEGNELLADIMMSRLSFYY